MSTKHLKENSGLLLDSKLQIKHTQNVPPLLISSKLSGPSSKNLRMNSPIQRKSSQYKVQQQITSSDQSFYANSLPATIKRLCSFDSSTSRANTQLGRLQEQKEILQRNFVHELQYYIRLRMKDLVTVQQLLVTNQIQRLRSYVQNELALLKKRHEDFLGEESFCKPTLTRDTFIKSNIEDDPSYKTIINNLIASIEQNQKNFTKIQSPLKKLNIQTELQTKKLASYFQQAPFEIKSSQASTNLAAKFINELGYLDGHQILEHLSKSIQQQSKGKYSMQFQQPVPKSQMSKLIEQHSLSKIKSKKSIS